MVEIGLPTTPTLAECSANLARLTKTAATLTEARRQTNTSPTEAQAEAGNYKKGRYTWKGVTIAIENPKGSTRSGTDGDGKEWSIKMKWDYGYFTRSDGKDGDEVDVFVGPHQDSELVFVINQVDPKTKKFDEHKVVVGATNEWHARRVYNANYESGWEGLGSIRAMTLPDFKEWLKDPKQTHKQAEDDEHTPTVAVDLDGTLATQGEKYTPDHIPPPRPGAKKWMDKIRDTGARILINTCRGDEKLIKTWLDDNDIPYDYINENPDQPEGTSDKILADVYWDDRAVSAKGRLADSAPEVIERLK